MSQPLIERLRRARQTVVPVQGRSFTVRRPTDLEMHEIAGKVEQRLLLVRFVTDWGVMTEIDLGIPGGGPDPVPFDAALWEEWMADHPEVWPDLTKAIFDSYAAHRAAMGEAAKNSAPWLGELNLPGGPGAPPDAAQIALDAWNLMGGEIAWPAMDFICELFGVTDVERFIVQLTAIRDRPK